jgi:hypothetical protein
VIPVVGPRIISDPKGRYLRIICRWVGGAGFLPPDFDGFVHRTAEPGHGVAGSRWYRTFQNREMPRWLHGEYTDANVGVPVRWLHGMDDPVITPTLMRDYPDRFSDFHLETVEGGWSLDCRAATGFGARPAPRIPARSVIRSPARYRSCWVTCGDTILT